LRGLVPPTFDPGMKNCLELSLVDSLALRSTIHLRIVAKALLPKSASFATPLTHPTDHTHHTNPCRTMTFPSSLPSDRANGPWRRRRSGGRRVPGGMDARAAAALSLSLSLSRSPSSEFSEPAARPTGLRFGGLEA